MYLFSSPRCLKIQSNVSKRKTGVVDSGSRGRSAVWSDIFWVVFCILTCQHCTILLQALQPMSWASGAISECAWSMCPGKMAKSVVDSRLHWLSSFSGLRWCEFLFESLVRFRLVILLDAKYAIILEQPVPMLNSGVGRKCRRNEGFLFLFFTWKSSAINDRNFEGWFTMGFWGSASGRGDKRQWLPAFCHRKILDIGMDKPMMFASK